MKKLSIAIPLYNEEKVLPLLLDRLTSVFAPLKDLELQIIMVDDGSADRTWDILEEAAGKDPRILALRFSRNFGQQAAYLAALEHATGDGVVMMDADLQDPPEVIPAFIKLHESGYDVVYATRANRKENFVLKSCYYMYYRLLAVVTNFKMPSDSGDFALISRPVLDIILSSKEQPKYLRGLRSWAGFRQIGVEIDRPERAEGESKYTVRKLVKLALDGIFSFSVLPLKIASVLGIFATIVSVMFGIYAFVRKVSGGGSPSGFTALLITMIFLSGIQMLLLGMLSEYIGRLYEQAKERPSYVIRKKVDFAAHIEQQPLHKVS